jgi:ubiquinone biosynthesis protein Coq4
MKCKVLHPFRNTFLTKHHLYPKSRKLKQSYDPKFMLKLWRDKHDCFHFIFLNATIDEIISEWYKYKRLYKSNAWKFLFNNLDFDESRKLLARMLRIKQKM